VKTSQLIHQIKRLDDDLLKARGMGSKVQLLKTTESFRRADIRLGDLFGLW
jgi:hypothetical protein